MFEFIIRLLTPRPKIGGSIAPVEFFETVTWIGAIVVIVVILLIAAAIGSI
jgi:hypothetical protein